VSVRVHHTEGDTAAKKLLEVASNSLAVFQERFGPYRYRELDIVRTPVRIALGTEYPGIVTVDSALSPDEAEWTVAHEVAHQWWYAEVGNDGKGAPWIDEALPSYSAALYIESALGKKEAEKRLYDGLKEGCQAMYDDRIRDVPVDWKGDSYNLWNYGAVVYARGAVFWHEVRKLLGDEAFFEATKAHYRGNIGKSVDADRLVAPFRERAPDPEAFDQLTTRWLSEAHCFEDILDKSPKKLDKMSGEFHDTPKGRAP